MILASNITLHIFKDDSWLKLAHATSGTLNNNAEMREVVNNIATPWESMQAGKLSWEFAGNNLVAYDATMGLLDLISYLVDAGKILIKFTTNTAGHYEYEGYAYISNITINIQTGQNFTFSFTATGDDELEQNLIGLPID